MSEPMARALSQRSTHSLLGDQNMPWGYPLWIDVQDNSKRASVGSRPSISSLDSEHNKLPPFSRTLSLPHVASRNSRLINEAALGTSLVDIRDVPLSSNQVAPRHVKLISCLGDSLLTGLCVSAQPNTLKNKVLSTLGRLENSFIPWVLSGEHRNNTCISGGGSGVVSIGRLLKTYSPDIVGLTSHKTYLFSRGSGFNFARSGSTIDALKDQSRRFVSKLRSPEYRHLQDQWKMIFIWIGANDVLLSKKESIALYFEPKLVQAIQFLKSVVTKLHVHLLTLPDLSEVRGNLSEDKKNSIREKTLLINHLLTNIMTKYKWNTTEEFVLVLQPIPNERIPHGEMRPFLSELDQTHPNFMAQQIFAKCIWNNLFLNKGEQLQTISEVINSTWTHPDPLEDIFFAV